MDKKIYSLFVLNGDKPGSIIPLLHEDSSYVFDSKVKLFFDNTKGSYVIDGMDAKVNNSSKKVNCLKDGDKIQFGDIVYRFEEEYSERVFDFEKTWYSEVFTKENNCINKFAFKYLFNLELTRSKRYKRPFSLIYLRINHMEDSFQTMADIQLILDSNLRETDLCTDYSENELLILLPETEEQKANLVANKLVFELKRMYKGTDIDINCIGFLGDEDISSINTLIAKSLNV